MRAHAAQAGIFVGQPAEQVVEQPFAQRAVGDTHGLDAEPVEHFRDDRKTAGKIACRSVPVPATCSR
jgi:hypothetical protein